MKHLKHDNLGRIRSYVLALVPLNGWVPCLSIKDRPLHIHLKLITGSHCVHISMYSLAHSCECVLLQDLVPPQEVESYLQLNAPAALPSLRGLAGSFLGKASSQSSFLQSVLGQELRSRASEVSQPEAEGKNTERKIITWPGMGVLGMGVLGRRDVSFGPGLRAYSSAATWKKPMSEAEKMSRRRNVEILASASVEVT